MSKNEGGGEVLPYQTTPPPPVKHSLILSRIHNRAHTRALRNINACGVHAGIGKKTTVARPTL